MTWTRFMDMHSGGGLKEEPYTHIFIEAPEAEARVIFYRRFGHNPERVSCTCCGDDYSISESESLEVATAYDRNCAHVFFFTDTEEVEEASRVRYGADLVWDRERRTHTKDGRPVQGRYVEEPDLTHMTYGATEAECVADFRSLEKYLTREDVLVIYAADIAPGERVGTIPEQGYVWMD